MNDPVEWIGHRLAQIAKVVKDEPRKIERQFEYPTTLEGEPLYCYDDDYYHPLTGDPLTIITLAAATRQLLELHERWERPKMEPVGSGCVETIKDGKTFRDWSAGSITGWRQVGVYYECGHCMHPDESQMEWPCPTLLALAAGWGWTENP